MLLGRRGVRKVRIGSRTSEELIASAYEFDERELDLDLDYPDSDEEEALTPLDLFLQKVSLASAMWIATDAGKWTPSP